MENTTDNVETKKDLEELIHENYMLAETLHQITFSHDREDEIKRDKELYLINVLTDKAGELYRAFHGKEE